MTFLFSLEWPVRTLSFSHDGELLASGSEDQVIDIAHVATGERIAHIPVAYPTFTLAWVSYIHSLYFLVDTALLIHPCIEIEMFHSIECFHLSFFFYCCYFFIQFPDGHTDSVTFYHLIFSCSYDINCKYLLHYIMSTVNI